MSYSADIKNLLSFLKKKGHSRAAIEEKLGLAENALTQSVSREGSLRILKGLELYREWVLNSSTSGKEDFMVEEEKVPYGNDMQSLISQQNKLIYSLNNQSETANIILKRIADNVELRVERIDANLNDALGRVDSLKLDLISGRTVVLQSLARLEKKKPGALILEADNIVSSILSEQKQKLSKRAGKGK